MGIGSAIGLIAVGAILAFATHFHLAAVDVQLVGWILMATGAISLYLSIVFMRRRRLGLLADVVEETPVVVADEPPPPHVLGDHIIRAHPEVERAIVPVDPPPGEEAPPLVEEAPTLVEPARDPEEAPPLPGPGGPTHERVRGRPPHVI